MKNLTYIYLAHFSISNLESSEIIYNDEYPGLRTESRAKAIKTFVHRYANQTNNYKYYSSCIWKQLDKANQK